MKYTVEELPEFKRDLKGLKKRYKKLEKDLERFKNSVADSDLEAAFANKLLKCTNTGCAQKDFRIYKKLASEDLKSTNEFRIVFFYKGQTIYLLEIFFKGDKQNEDYGRFAQYCDF